MRSEVGRGKGWVAGVWMWLLLAWISTGCAAKAARLDAPKVPDTTGIMRLIGKYSIASGCPIGARRILTNAHVIDIRPFDKDVSLMPMLFQQGDRLGTLVPESVSLHRDIGYMSLVPGDDDLAMWYPLATVQPKAGDTIYLSAYDWGSRKSAFSERVITAKVVRVIAGHIVFDPPGVPGSSGSCVLNEAGEVVGINAFGKAVGYQGRDEVGGAVLMLKGMEEK